MPEAFGEARSSAHNPAPTSADAAITSMPAGKAMRPVAQPARQIWPDKTAQPAES